MATISLAAHVTASELSKHILNGMLVPLVQALSKEIQWFGDANMEAANDGSGHSGTTENSQPTGTFHGFNEGYAVEAPTSVEFREPLTMLSGRYVAHLALLMKKAGGDPGKAGALRARGIEQFMVGMIKNIMTELLYGTRSQGKSPLGIMQRSDTNTLSSAYVYDNAGGAASGTANKTSCLLIGHGPMKYTLIHPKGESPGNGRIDQPGLPIEGIGIRMRALHDDWVEDLRGSADNKFLAVRNDLNLDLGHAIMDARYVLRLANVSTSNIDGVDDFSLDEQYLINMLSAIPDTDNAVFYVNRTLKAQLWNRVNIKGNVFHTTEDPFGKKVLHVDNVPIHVNEQIVDTEATVT